MRVMILAVSLASVVAVAAACAPGACGNAESHCTDAHTIESCAGSVDAVGQSRHSSTTACPASAPYCVDTTNGPTPSAACVESDQKAPECAADPNGSLCEDGAPTVCRNGYAFRSESCDGAHACVVVQRQALCVVGAGPDPACAQITQQRDACDGDVLVDCYYGYALDKTACATGTCNADEQLCDALTDAGSD